MPDYLHSFSGMPVPVEMTVGETPKGRAGDEKYMPAR